MNGVADFYWREGFAETRSPDASLLEYHQIKEKIDLYRWALITAQQKNILLKVKDFDLTGRNHHEYTAAYLSCHYRNNRYVTSRILPLVLGVSYKLLCSVTEEKTVRSAVQNVENGIVRYQAGIDWGFNFCAG